MDRFQALFSRLRQAPPQPPSSTPKQPELQARQRRIVVNELGGTGMEYALIACFIAIIITVGTSIAGNGLNQMFYVIGNKMMFATNAVEEGSN